MKIRELAGAEHDLEEALIYYSDLSLLCVEDLLHEIAVAKMDYDNQTCHT